MSEFAGDLVRTVGIGLQHLDQRLTDLLRGTGNRGLRLPPLADNLGIRALQAQRLGFRHQSLLQQGFLVARLFPDQLELSGGAVHLRLVALDLLDQLLAALVEHVFLHLEADAPALEHGELRLHHGDHLGLPGPQLRGPVDRGLIPALRLQPGLLGQQRPALLHQGVMRGVLLLVLQYQQGLTGLHAIAIAHLELGDDAAFQVLHRLAAAVGVEHAGRHSAAGDRDCEAPDADVQAEYKHDGDAGAHRPADAMAKLQAGDGGLRRQQRTEREVPAGP